MQKAKSSPNLSDLFSAKPFPADIFTGHVYEKMRAQREYREVQGLML